MHRLHSGKKVTFENFYEDLEKARAQCKSQDVVIVMGDMNAKVGEGRVENMVGDYGLGERNERGEKLINWCNTHNQVIANTWFIHHKRRLYTWKSPGDRVRNQIDYITINERFRNSVTQCKTYPGADCGSDHIPMICNFTVKLKKLAKTGALVKRDFALLVNDQSVRDQYNIEVRNRLKALSLETGSSWENFRNSLEESADVTLPVKKTQKKPKWMAKDILEMVEGRQKIKDKDSIECKQLNNKVKVQCSTEKEEWLNKWCEEIEGMKNTDSRKMHAEIKEISNRKAYCISSKCIRAKNGEVLMTKKDILDGWTE